jgi:hypothetical protein
MGDSGRSGGKSGGGNRDQGDKSGSGGRGKR